MPSFVKPAYIDPAGLTDGETVSVRPPILFREVTARVFPLKANIARLNQFCDEYLNMDIPDEIVHFTPALPYVYFMVLNYGGMSATSLAAQRAGWVSQHEVLFLVPLQRWRRENGKLAFKDWATVSPFIFVDDPMSQTTGREVYGWPKVLGRIEADLPLWATHPRAPTRLFTLSTNMFANVYAGQPDTPQVLVTVDRDPVASYAEFPADLKCPWSPTSLIPNVIRSSLSLMGEAIDLTAGLRLRGYPPGRDLGALLAMTGKASSMIGKMLSGLLLPVFGDRPAAGTKPEDPYALGERSAQRDLPNFFTQTLNLKQFRDPESPELSCYTALVQSAMGVDRVNQIGLLGDWDLLRGDPSGGYSIGIHRYQSQPIIESLGIEVPAGYRDAGEGAVVALRPSFPFWMDVDLYYGGGEVICSRTSNVDYADAHSLSKNGAKLGVWMPEEAGERPGGGKAPAPLPEKAPPMDSAVGATPAAESAAGRSEAQAAGVERRLKANQGAPNAFNNSLGAATQPVVGPFHFPDVTMQVYPLLADPAKLNLFVDRCWNQPFVKARPKLSFETLGSYVYMIVTVIGDDRGTMWSDNNNIGWWAQREVSFCVPVKWFHAGELISLGMIEPFVYANHGRSVVTDREVNGRNAIVATIDSPKDIWMAPSPGGPAGARRFVHVATESFTALNAGGKALRQTLFEIDERDVLPPDDFAGWRGVADAWGAVLVDDLKRKTLLASTQQNQVRNVQALALELFAHKSPVNRITMKQYRDAQDMERACYQAAVHTERAITRVYDLREITHRVHVRMHRLPGHPIVDTLGLRIKTVDSAAGAVVENLQPIRPFWMHVAVKEELGTIIGTVRPAKYQESAAPVSEDPDRDWVFSHPWFKPDAARSVGEPYFRAPGCTRVAAWLATNLEHGNNQNLRDKCDRWLRTSSTNELALKRRFIESLKDEKRKAPLDQTMRASSEWAAYSALLEAPALPSRPPDERSFRSVCDAMSLDQMASLERTIEQAFKHLKLKPKELPEPSWKEELVAAVVQQKINIEALPEQERTKLEEKVKQTNPEWGRYLTLGADAFRSKCQTLSVDQLASLKETIEQEELYRRAAADQVSKLPDAPEAQWRDSLAGMLKRLEKWVMAPPNIGGERWDQLIPEQAAQSIMNLHSKRLRVETGFDSERLLLLEMTLDYGVWHALDELLRRSVEPEPFHVQQRDYATAALYRKTTRQPLPMDPVSVLKAVSDGLGACINNWEDPGRWVRLTRAEAAKAVSTLGDIQLIIERILSDEWESKNPFLHTQQPNAGSPKFGAYPNEKPDHCVPVSSVGPFGAPSNGWAASLGLDRWPDELPDEAGHWELVVAHTHAKA